MTTIKSILNWLFDVFNHSPALQVMLVAVAFLHVVILLTLYFSWLIGVLNRWTA